MTCGGALPLGWHQRDVSPSEVFFGVSLQLAHGHRHAGVGEGECEAAGDPSLPLEEAARHSRPRGKVKVSRSCWSVTKTTRSHNGTRTRIRTEAHTLLTVIHTHFNIHSDTSTSTVRHIHYHENDYRPHSSQPVFIFGFDSLNTTKYCLFTTKTECMLN